MTVFVCSSCQAAVEGEDLEELMAEGWHVVRASAATEAPETILCPDCFQRGPTIEPPSY
jgi:hypothetical protein